MQHFYNISPVANEGQESHQSDALGPKQTLENAAVRQRDYISVTHMESEGNDDGITNKDGSIDLNKPASDPGVSILTASFITPRSSMRKKAIVERRDLNQVGSQSVESDSVDVQNTIAVGNMVWFDMNGLEKEVHGFMVAERGSTMPK